MTMGKLPLCLVLVLAGFVRDSEQTTSRWCGSSTNAAYYYSSHTKTQADAQQFCIGLGGDLVWIESAEENHWLGSQILHLGHAPYWYIGYEDQNGRRSCWIGGQACGYSNYAPSEPNRDNEECVTMEIPKHYQWADVRCSRSLNFICKVSDAAWVTLGSGLHQYLFSASPLTQLEAEEFCQESGGSGAHLIWFDDVAEVSLIRDALVQLYSNVPHWYIGLYDFVGGNVGHDYHWLSGAVTSYTRFAQGEPNRDHENCVTMERSSQYRWHDVVCSRAEKFVCKRPKH